jgi:hypothetical protein
MAFVSQSVIDAFTKKLDLITITNYLLTHSKVFFCFSTIPKRPFSLTPCLANVEQNRKTSTKQARPHHVDFDNRRSTRLSRSGRRRCSLSRQSIPLGTYQNLTMAIQWRHCSCSKRTHLHSQHALIKVAYRIGSRELALVLGQACRIR